MKTVKRTVIIRDRDLVDIMRISARTGLWDRIDSEPVTYQGIQHDNLVLALKEPDNRNIPRHSTLPMLYENMLFRERDLYNKNYLNWELTMDYPAGQIYVRSRQNQPREPLVRAYLEKDLG
jgi:hypothetical protein